MNNGIIVILKGKIVVNFLSIPYLLGPERSWMHIKILYYVSTERHDFLSNSLPSPSLIHKISLNVCFLSLWIIWINFNNILTLFLISFILVKIPNLYLSRFIANFSMFFLELQSRFWHYIALFITFCIYQSKFMIS